MTGELYNRMKECIKITESKDKELYENRENIRRINILLESIKDESFSYGGLQFGIDGSKFRAYTMNKDVFKNVLDNEMIRLKLEKEKLEREYEQIQI